MDYRSTEGMMQANRHHPSPPWMRVAQTSPHRHPSLMIHQTRSASSMDDHHYRHVPVMSTVLSHDSAGSVSSSTKRDYFPQESPRQVAASVLMIAKGRSHSPDDRSRPLKKRKTFATQVPMPCHVSPVSSHADDRTQVTQYSREEDDDNDSKATSDAAVVPHFPSVLHMLLTTSKDGVLEWLEHGKAWRIVRWEALRRSILPQFFPQLQSMDAFLAHISAWGFREVTEGSDVGAYINEVRFSFVFKCNCIPPRVLMTFVLQKFRRDSPEMCREMSLPKAEDTPVRCVQPKTIGSSPRSILRVPSLSAGYPEKGDTSVPISTAEIVRSPDTPNMATDRVKTPPAFNDGNNTWERRPVFVNYRPEAMAVRPSSIMPPYSPISIQSGRGRRSFFVSNRGRSVSAQRRSLPITGRACSDDGNKSPSPPHPNSVAEESEAAQQSRASTPPATSEV